MLGAIIGSIVGLLGAIMGIVFGTTLFPVTTNVIVLRRIHG